MSPLPKKFNPHPRNNDNPPWKFSTPPKKILNQTLPPPPKISLPQKISQPPPPPPENFSIPQKISQPPRKFLNHLKISQPPLKIYLFSFTFQKKSENFGGCWTPWTPPPPLKYALVHMDITHPYNTYCRCWMKKRRLKTIPCGHQFSNLSSQRILILKNMFCSFSRT